MQRTGSRRRTAAVLTGLLLALAAAATIAGAAGPAQGQRIDLKVLLLSATGNEPAFDAWKGALEREGVPYDAKIADNEAPFTDATFADYGANRARYQAVILANGDLLHPVANPDGTQSFLSALSDAEWAAVAKFERTFGIRQISDSTFPSPSHGLQPPTEVGADQGGTTAQLTPAGITLLPELKGPVPIDAGAFGFRSTPASPAFQTLMTGTNGAAFLGIYTHPDDGREEMVMTVDGNRFQTHDNLLRHGMLGWVTRGVYLGYQRRYFEMHVDDIFLPDDRWNSDLNRTAVDGPTTAADEVTCDADPATTAQPDCRPIRMLPADVDRLLAWQAANGLVLDMVYNGDGHEEMVRETGSDALATRILAVRSQLRWINHTYTHPNLDAAPLATLTSEIAQNIAWAQRMGIAIDPAELVTGEHSGLKNPLMPAALSQTPVRWLASDNSREPAPYAIGPATTVPRHPSNVYYNVATQAEQLDEYNHIYLAPPNGRCVGSATNTCRTAPATWDEYVASEAAIMFRHIVGNDPRPHYSHQSNLAEEGVLYRVLDAVIGRYRTHFKPPIVQLTMRQISETLARDARWRADLAAGKASAYLLDGQVHIEVTERMEVPVTGTALGEEYGGLRSGWGVVTPQTPVTIGTSPRTPAGASLSSSPAARRAPAATQTSRRGAARRLAPVIRRLTMSPRAITVAHRKRTQRGRKPDGAVIGWRLSTPATLRLVVERRVGRRFRRVGTLVRRSKQSTGELRFTGRFGTRRLRPGRYRLVVTATAPPAPRSAARVLSFSVKEG